MAAVMHSEDAANDRVAVYSARRKTFIADCEDVAIRLRINNRNRSENLRPDYVVLVSSTREIAIHGKSSGTFSILIKRCTWDSKLTLERELDEYGIMTMI